MKEKVVKLANSIYAPPGFSEEFILSWIDYRGPSSPSTTTPIPTPTDQENQQQTSEKPILKPSRFWTIDPVDGTAGFLRAEQYAVCLALVQDGKVILGVLGCPNLPPEIRSPDSSTPASVKRSPEGSLLVAVSGQGAFMRTLNDANERTIRVSKVSDSKEANFCESVEAAHSSHSDSAKIAAILGITKPGVRMDSQCKYAAIARGDASIYLRLSKASYHECIWDHAAGTIIVQEAGGTVTDLRGKPLDFTQGKKLSANHGVVATNGILHDVVLKAIEDVLFPPINKYKVQITSSLLTTTGTQKDHTEITPQSLQQALAKGLNIDPSLIVVESE